jgi:hypothetical protein
MWQQLVELFRSRRPAPADDLDRVRSQVEEELAAALAGVERWAPAALARQRPRLEALCAAWADRVAHLRTLERMLSDPEAAPPDRERWRRVGQRARSELLAVWAWVRELASMLRLARRSGAPAARAEELLGHLAAAAVGLSAAAPYADSPAAGGT